MDSLKALEAMWGALALWQQVASVGAAGSGPAPPSFILLENGVDQIELEDGSGTIQLES
jgi:hypothetical protein